MEELYSLECQLRADVEWVAGIAAEFLVMKWIEDDTLFVSELVCTANETEIAKIVCCYVNYLDNKENL